MKLKNLFPAALAVVALASCTTDEIESTGAKQQPSFAQKGDLRITSFDTEDVATRALANKLYQLQTYEDGDKIYVYDQDMHATDIYAYDVDENAFYFEEQFPGDEKQIAGEPSFGVFAGVVNKNPKGYVLRTEEGTPTCVDIKLPHVLKYKEKVVDGVAMYGFDIPAFAAASYSTDPSDPYIALDNYRYLTALLRVKLENAFGNVSYIRVSNAGPDNLYIVGQMGDSKALSGNLTAKLYKGDDRTNSKLEVVDEDYLVYPEVYIDLTNVPSNTSFIYIPIIAGLDGDVDHIKLEYTANRNISDVESEKDNNGADIAWHTIPGMQFPGTVFQANKRYFGSYSYELADMNPKKVSDLLAQYASTANDIILNITKSFTIDATNPEVDNVIYLPDFENDVNVIINLADPLGTGWANTNTDDLIITDDPLDGNFSGTITINVGAGNTLANEAIEVDLEEGTAELVGTYNNTLTLTSAGKVKIGDGTNATNGLTWTAVGDDIQAIEIAKEATVNSDIDASAATNLTASVVVNGTLTGDITGGAATKTITVGKTGALTGNITTGEAKTLADKVTVTVAGQLDGGITSGTDGYFTDVNVSGKVLGGTILNTAVKGTLNITSTFATPDESAMTGVETAGDVIVNLGAEGEAISGMLTMIGCNKTLTLKNGYVNSIYSNVGAGEWEKPYINIVFDDAEGRTAFKGLATGTKNEIVYNKSTWSGLKITNASYKNVATNYANAQAPETKKSSTFAVFSAAQLATLGNESDVTNVDIFNDIDLNDKNTWTGISKLTGEFDGLSHKISNLNLSEATARGLINRNSGTVVKNLVIENVKGEKAATAAKQGSLGALIGVQTGTVAVSDVEITGIDLKMTAETNEKIGGVIGAALSGASATLTDVTVSGAIDGYRALGGLIGQTSIPVIAANCDASGITFAQTFNSGKAMDIDYAKIGGFIGTVSANVAVNITSGKAPESIAYGQPDKMYVSDISSETGDFFTYQAKQNFIGFSGNDNTAAASKIAASTINGTNYCAEANFGSEALTHLHGTATYTFLYTWKAK